MPTDRPIDGVDQTDVLLGNSMMGHRESLLSFIGADLVAARWKQWRIYFTDVHPTGNGPQREPGIFSASASLAGYPKVYNIEMDPHEDLVVGGYSAGYPDPRSKRLMSIWRQSKNIQTHRRRISPNSRVVVGKPQCPR
jgi:arylsulfatase